MYETQYRRRVEITKHIVLENHKNLFVIQTATSVYTIPKNDYFVLKLNHFDGNRIFYDFEQYGARVEETYNDGVFNCYHGKYHVQIVDGNGIAKTILDRDYSAFFVLFARWHGIKQQKNVISAMLTRQYRNRIRFDKTLKMYIIDEILGVTVHGVGKQRLRSGEWSPLCLVMPSVKSHTFSLPGIGPVVINAITQTILAKAMFLMFPRKDNVFLSQLDNTVRAHVMRLIKEHGGTGRGGI